MAPELTRRHFIAGFGAASLLGAGSAVSSADPATTYALAPGVIHLNTASLGATSNAVLDRTLAAWRELESSPVRMAYGKDGPPTLLQACETVRAQAAAFLNCDADELLITRCTTEGMNTVAQGIAWKQGDRILTTDQEHHGGSLCWEYAAQRHGAAIDRVAIAPEEHDVDAIAQRIEAAMTPRTRVISVSHVISTTGLRMPVAAIAKMARARGVLCVVDGAQAVGQIPVDVKALGCDAYATSGHKWLMGPKGTGMLYVSRDASDAIRPIQWQDAHRYGAESAGVGPQPLVIGLGAAIQRVQEIGIDAIERHNAALRNKAYAGLQEIAQVRVVGPPPGPLAAAMVAFVLPDAIDSQRVLETMLEKHRIIVKKVEKRWFNGIRVSPHVLNGEGEIDAFLDALQTMFPA